MSKRSSGLQALHAAPVLSRATPAPPHWGRATLFSAGLVQTGLYCDFFYHYYESKTGGMNKAVKLPV